MIITVCDACGSQYRKYDGVSANLPGNAISIYKKGKGGKLEPSLKLDLCPECMEQVWSFVREDLVTEKSPRYAKIMATIEGTVGSSEEIGEVAAESDYEEEADE